MINMCKEFKNFLRKHGKIRAFVKNLQLSSEYSNCKTVEEYYEARMTGDNCSVDNLIMVAFVWDDAPERHNFWSKLDDKWIKKYNELIS